MRPLAGVACAAALLLPPGAGGEEPPKGGAVRLTAAQAEALVREVSATVERLRKLRFKAPVAVEVVDGAAARKDFEKDVDDAARKEAGHVRDAWVHLGLVPEKTDLVAAQLDLAEKDVLGYYETGSKVFRLLDHVAEADVRSVMAHELTHALEDQHYDLGALQKTAANEDQAVAIRAVVEGSAMVTTLAIESRQGGIGKAKEEAAKTSQVQAKRVQGAPTFVQMRLLLPYTLGFSFLLRGRPWDFLRDGVRLEDIEHAYAHPPHSTREILHPEQYWLGRRDSARPFALADLSRALGPGWSQAVTGSIGELGLTLLTGSTLKTDGFEVLMPTRWITAGATGNAGELYQHHVNGERKATVLVTRWESLQDADEFQRSLRGAGRKLYRIGANVLVLAGDVGDRGEAVAAEAARGLQYWAGP
ncbi:MAG TPA: hypothetical protein VGB87_11425 [Vicinamibacteria bacterium]